MPRKPSVLVVDDSQDGREMLAEYLAFSGFSVAEARNGAEALEVARRARPDIVLMDLSMPVLDGWEATRRLKADAATKSLVIIALTAHAFPPEQEAAMAVGCDAVVSKPYDLALLVNALRRIVKHGAGAFDAKKVKAKPRRPTTT